MSSVALNKELSQEIGKTAGNVGGGRLIYSFVFFLAAVFFWQLGEGETSKVQGKGQRIPTNFQVKM
jgi:hypothetical protein